MLESAKPPSRDVRFFVELHPELYPYIPEFSGKSRAEVLNTILNQEVLQTLDNHNWGLAVATIDLDTPTAQVINRINNNFPHLPITTWIVLPEDQGYWTSGVNINPTRKRIKETTDWINRHHLSISGIGLDIEPPISVIKDLLRGLRPGITALAKHHLALREQGSLPQAYTHLTSELQHSGASPELYVFPKGLAKVFGAPPPETSPATMYTMQYDLGFPKWLLKPYQRLGLQPNSFPAFGDVSTLRNTAGKTIGSGRILGPAPSSPITLEKLQANIQAAKPEHLTRFRVFALTDTSVITATVAALEKRSPNHHSK